MLADPVGFVAWRSVADALPVMMFSTTVEGSIEYVNPRWFAFTGLAPGDSYETAWKMSIHPDDVAHVAAQWRRALDSGDDAAFDFRLQRAGRSHAWVTCTLAPTRDKSGTIVRWCGTLVDVDAAKRAVSTLRERATLLTDYERRFGALAESIPVICWTADANGWIDWYNRRWYEYTGQTIDEASGWGWQAAHHPDDFLEVMRRWPHSIATGEPFEMEFRLRRADGLFHWFLTRAEPLRDERGMIVRWYGSNVDIDAQKLALERTKRVAETLQDVFLPKELPQPSGLRLDAVYLTAEKDALVGGDWFDAFEVPDGRLVFSIGDVAGHGLQASTLVGRLRQAIFTLAFNIADPAVILAETNRILHHQEPDTIVTALIGFVDPDHTKVTYASAGHPPPLIAYRSDQPAAILPCGEPPLGVDPRQTFVNHEAPLQPHAVVAVYTDGMIEFSHDLFAAESKLRAAVSLIVGNTTIARPALAVKEIVFDDLPARDDAALLLLQFSDVDASSLNVDPAALEKRWRFHSSDAFSAHASRHEIMSYLRQMAEDPDEIFASELIVGEMLANTVEHAPGLVEVDIDWTGDQPVISIRDTGPGLAAVYAKLPDDVMDEDGRGIYLIKELAVEHSVRSAAGAGTELRAVLPIKRKIVDLDPKRGLPPIGARATTPPKAEER